MTGLIRKATLLSACALLAATAAMAGVPDPGHCSFPTFIKLAGNAAGVVDSVKTVFAVSVADVAGNAINASNVVVDLTGCADVRLASNQLNAAKTTTCSGSFHGSVSAYTNAAGQVRFAIVGNSAGAATQVGAFAKIYADGVLLTTISAATFDLDGASGVNGSDLSKLLTDLGLHINYNRDDYDGNALANGSDLSVMLGEIGLHASTATGATCP